MQKKIVYLNDDGNLSIVFPVDQSICGLSVEDIAKKDVPVGKPYLIVNDSDLPSENFDYASAWEADFSNPDGYGIGAEAWFASQENV